MPKRNTTKHNYKWVKTDLDYKKIAELVANIHFYANRIYDGSYDHKSILIDLDYGSLFDCVEELYTAAGIDILAQDHVERKAAEQVELKKKGLTNARSV